MGRWLSYNWLCNGVLSLDYIGRNTNNLLKMCPLRTDGLAAQKGCSLCDINDRH